MDICQEFRTLHVKGKPLVLANAWDAGSARVLAAKGAKAIGTSSAAHAFTLGRPDMGKVSRSESMKYAKQLAEAVRIPISGDFENGYGATVEDVQETIRQSIELGLAGCSIEDTALPSDKPYEFDEALRRIEAAVETKNALNSAFMLCARADGVMNGQYDIEEAISRIRAFEKVGADLLYVPMPETWDDLRRVVESVDGPVNVLVAGQFAQYSYDQFSEIGAARLSFGSALARVTHQAILNAADDIFERGDFSDFSNAASGNEVDKLLNKWL